MRLGVLEWLGNHTNRNLESRVENINSHILAWKVLSVSHRSIFYQLSLSMVKLCASEIKFTFFKPYAFIIHTKRNLVNIVLVVHLVKGAKLLNKLIGFDGTVIM